MSARTWKFRLDRHDDPEPDTTPVDPTPDTGPDVDWKAEAEKYKALSRKHEDRSKANATAVEERDKYKQQYEAMLKAAGINSDTEDPAEVAARLGAERDQATERATAAERHAFQSQVKLDAHTAAGRLGFDAAAALDSESFKDDFVTALDDKADDDPGHISNFDPGSREFRAEVERALGVALEKNPRFKSSRGPAPDPSQGRGGTSQTADFRTADKATFDAELAKMGLRPRSYR